MRLFHGRFHRGRVANTAAVEKLLTRAYSQAATLQKIAFMAFFVPANSFVNSFSTAIHLDTLSFQFTPAKLTAGDINMNAEAAELVMAGYLGKACSQFDGRNLNIMFLAQKRIM